MNFLSYRQCVHQLIYRFFAFSIKIIYEQLKEQKISAENLVLGMGGALLQKVDRDTQKFALKCSYAEMNGTGIEVFKSPTEMDANGNIAPSFKKSKAGRLKLIQINGKFLTVKEGEYVEHTDFLQTVFENGVLTQQITYENVRNNAKFQGKQIKGDF